MVWHLSSIADIEDIKVNVEEVRVHVAKYSKPDLYLAFRCLVVTAVLYVSFFAAYSYAAKHWALWAILVFLRGGFYDRMFVIFHDCCHGSFFKSSSYNMLVGRFIGSLQMTSWSGWHRNHNIDHHMHLGKDDHPLVDQVSMIGWTTKEWGSYSMPRKTLLRIVRNPIFFFTFVPTFIWLVAGVHNGKLPLIDTMVPSQPPYRIQDMDPIDRVLPTLLPALQACAGVALYGPAWLWFELATIMVATTIGIILFHLQHAAHVPNLYFDIPRHEHNRDLAGLMGSTYQYIPECFKWATLGIEYHHIHHFSTRVPSYLLRACHDSAPPGTWRYVKYLDFKTELQSLLLVMWNPDAHRFESFPELNWLLGLNEGDKKPSSIVPTKEASAKEE